ncbi:uracil-DNA glycosylase [Pseudomonas sp. App30]|uniref:uracil-DNA glycosylase n=1 Tax=Pseudomonas sp. App30 TaxID=3068990 RepID=UPI003A809A36
MRNLNGKPLVSLGSYDLHSSIAAASTMILDGPKTLKDPDHKAMRLSQIHASHVTTLNAFVQELRDEAGPDAHIPYFDPWDAGIAAQVLFLLEAPGAKAVASGFISRNNPDETAKNIFELSAVAGLERKQTVLWNVVPWYIGSGTRIRPATPKDLVAGLRPLPRLLALLPALRAVVLLGRKAEKAAALIATVRPDLKVFSCGHPSPLYVNRRLGNREKILATLHQVHTYVCAALVESNGSVR